MTVTESSICPGAALPSPALTRYMGAEEMQASSSSTWSDLIQVYADDKKYGVLRRIHT